MNFRDSFCIDFCYIVLVTIAKIINELPCNTIAVECTYLYVNIL